MRSGFFAGLAALALLAHPAHAAEHLGGLVSTRDLNGQTLLVTGFGLTLYTYDRDEPGVSLCVDACAEDWPPYYAPQDAAPEGDFTLVARPDGRLMWAYKGAPLYLSRNDVLVGDVTGDGVDGVWRFALE